MKEKVIRDDDDGAPDLLDKLFSGSSKKCKGSLDDFNLFDEMLLWVVMYQVWLNTFLPVNTATCTQTPQIQIVLEDVKLKTNHLHFMLLMYSVPQ